MIDRSGIVRSQRHFSFFMKIGHDKDIDALLHKGHIYCNHINYFRRIVDGTIRGDKNEGRSCIHQGKDLEVEAHGMIVGRADSVQIYEDDPKDAGNIFCLYGVESNRFDSTSSEIQKVIIEEKAKSFGQSVLLIYNILEFKQRIEAELERLNWPYRFEVVNYYDQSSYEGPLGPFYKSDLYSYQKEVRVWLPNEVDVYKDFFIGDISEISVKRPIEDINKLGVQFFPEGSKQ